MSIPRSLPTLCALVALSLSPTTFADVLVVNTAGSGDFTQLSDALGAAQDGDIVLVQSDFATDAFDVDAKAITLVSDGAGRRVLGALSVTNLGAEQSVTVRGFEIGPHVLSSFSGGTLIVRDCQGAVLTEDCLVHGLAGSGGGVSAMRLVDSPAVWLTRSTVLGGAGSSVNDLEFPMGTLFATPGGPGVTLDNSAISVFDSTVLGGDGGDNLFPSGPGRDGGSAFVGTNSRVWVEGGFAQGGSGGDGCLSAKDGCGGGAGIALDLDDRLSLRDASVSGGGGGALTVAGLTGSGTGDDGVDLVGQVAHLPGGASVLVDLSPVRTGEAGSLTVHGPQGATAAWFMSAGLQAQQLGGFKGVLALDFPLLGPYLLGVLPASGQLAFEFTVPSLAGTGLEGLVLTMQAIVVDGDGLRFSGPSMFVHVGETL